MRRFKNFTEAYVALLDEVQNKPEFECAPRGMKIKESLGVQFSIENPLDRIPYVKGRKFSISYMVAELVWYLMGIDATEWIANYSSFWRNISDDGVTANSAYGARIFKPHRRVASTLDPDWTQWDFVLNELANDNDSRRAVIHIRSPQDALLAKLDVPCTLTMQFFLREDNVHMVVAMRSSDLILGLAYDVPAFTMFQELLAHDLTKKLGRPIGLGTYTHTSNSLHIYERHFDMVDRIISDQENWKRPELPMPALPENMVTQHLNVLTSWEAYIRRTSDPQELDKTFHEMMVALKDNHGMSDYWLDWARILAAHKAGKLDDELLREKYMTETVFEGYRFFKK